jgi:predicted ATP-grasp superfamily ATP-dependent carboligase
MKPRQNHIGPESVILSSINNVNSLGVLRGISAKGIPVITLDVDPHSMVRYCRFASKRFSCPSPIDSEEGFIGALIELGRSLNHRPVFIPTGDAEVLALARHREALLPYYRMPVSSFDTIDILVNKKRFFQDVIRQNIPCPRTCFPETLAEMREMAADIGYPLIIKAAYSHQFIREFNKKVFVTHSPLELETAIELLNKADLDFFLQEIIPGDTLYLFYSYFNRQSVPLGICGYDKVRQFPKDFGIGTICRSKNRPQPIQAAVEYLRNIGYTGLAEPEFKLDQRDGQYKLIEINTRAVTMTLLAKACGVHMEYLAYLDLTSGEVEPLGPATEGIVWIDEINELHYQLSRIRRGHFSFIELLKILKGKKVFACSSLADPIPLIIGLAQFFYERYKSPRNVDTMLGI